MIQTAAVLKTNDGYNLIDDSVGFSGEPRLYELVPTGRLKGIMIDGKTILVPSFPTRQDVPVRYNYVSNNGEQVRNWYRSPLQIFKIENGVATPVNDKGQYAINPAAKIQFVDGRLTVDASNPGLIRFLDEHPSNGSNPKTPNKSPLFRRIDRSAEQKDAFKLTKQKNEAIAKMAQFLANQNEEDMGSIQTFISVVAKMYQSTTTELPGSGVKDYMAAYTALSGYALKYPIQTLDVLKSLTGDNLSVVITDFICNAFAANVLVWKNDKRTGGGVAFSSEVVQKNNKPDDTFYGYVPVAVNERISVDGTPDGQKLTSLAQFYLYLRGVWATPEGEEIRKFVEENSSEGNNVFTESRPNPLAGKYHRTIRAEKMDELRAAEYYFKKHKE